jgi:hypothetical protein
MSRQITAHQALPMNALNKQLDIIDDGAGLYQVRWPGQRRSIVFHIGDPREPNGLSLEALLAICVDRLESFRAGGVDVEHNEQAIAHLREAMFWLHVRTTDRIMRGVEGTAAP